MLAPYHGRNNNNNGGGGGRSRSRSPPRGQQPRGGGNGGGGGGAGYHHHGHHHHGPYHHHHRGANGGGWTPHHQQQLQQQQGPGGLSQQQQQAPVPYSHPPQQQPQQQLELQPEAGLKSDADPWTAAADGGAWADWGLGMTTATTSSLLRRLEVPGQGQGQGRGGLIQLTRLVERPGLRAMQVPAALAATGRLPWRASSSSSCCTASACCRGRHGNGQGAPGCDARRLLAALRRKEVFAAAIEPAGPGEQLLDQW